MNFNKEKEQHINQIGMMNLLIFEKKNEKKLNLK